MQHQDDERWSPRRTETNASTDHPQPQHLQRMYGDNILPVIFTDHPFLLHTADHPFCFCDPDCPCHEEDQESIDMVNAWVQEGLMTPQEASLFVAGKIF